MARPRDNSHRARLVSVVFTAVALGLVLTATLFHVPPDWPLAGTEGELKTPPLTLRSWFDGSFAKNAEPWLLRRFGFRGFAIRAANQIDYSLFGRLPESRGTAVLQGKDGWLFEHSYQRFFEGQFGADEEKTARMARDLAAIRSILAECGTRLVVVIAPSKMEIYPEYLPPAIQKGLSGPPARQQVSEALRAHGLPVVDGHELLLSWKAEKGGPLLFPEYGTHWNSYAAQRILDCIWTAAAMTSSLPHVVGYKISEPTGMDTDLLDLLNLPFYRGILAPKVPHPVLLKEKTIAATHRALLMGDSFCFQIIDAMERTGAFSDAKLLYYFRGVYDFRFQTGKPLGRHSPRRHRTGSIQDHTAIDWNVFFDGYDLVILEFNEIFARKYLWGFPDVVLPGLTTLSNDLSQESNQP